MLKAVLTKLIKYMATYNSYVTKGVSAIATNCNDKCMLLLECLSDAGYTPQITTECVEIMQGPSCGCRRDLYTSISFYIPIVSADAIDELHNTIKVFENVGFEHLQKEGILTYKFATDRKEETV